MHNIRSRPAIAMIELIFALVIMGIALMSAPMLMSVASSSVVVALQQEGLNEASSRVNMILTYPWDENDTNDSCIPPVLVVSKDGDSQLEMIPSTYRRVGVPLTTNSRTFKCGDKNLTASIVVDGKNDIDDFIGTTRLDTPGGGSGGVDYIEQKTVLISTAVSFGNDSADYDSQQIAFAPAPGPGGSTNIKIITVTLTSDSSVDELKEKSITFTAFSCNIGGIAYRSKEI